ncbi:MAG TPA: hypothetical protein VK427_11550, partial [Kofleriaceae bacterium]|nr:hypothetical protein [Kofleriaceae bacterium]
MRWLVVSIIVMLPVIAMAKPGVAVAPLDGDDGNKIASIVVKVLAADGMAVVGPKDTAKAMKKLGLAGKLSKPEQKKLRKKLGVDVLVQGQVEEKAVELRVAGRGVTTSRFAVKFKSAKSPNLEDDLREALGKRLAPGESDDDDAEDDKPARVAERDDEDSEPKKKRKKRRDDDEPTTRHPVTQAAVRANIGAAFARRGLTYA